MKTIWTAILFCAAAAAQTAWTPLAGTTFNTALCPPDGFGGSVTKAGTPYPYRSGGQESANMGCSSAVIAWNGGVARTKAGSEELYFLGQGGHGDYGGNEVYMLNLHASPPTFTRLDDPSVLLATYYNNDVASYPDGRPASRHRYDGLTYHSGLDKFFVFGGAVWGGNSANPHDGWWYDPNTRTWSKVTPSTAGGCMDPAIMYTGQGQSAVYNPNDGFIYIGTGGSGSWFIKLSPATSCYTLVSQNWPQDDTWKMILDTARNRFLLVGRGSAYTMSTTGTATNITSSIGAGCSAVISSYGPGGFYDAVGDSYVLYPQTGGNTLYKLNPSTWACTTVATTGGPTGNPIRGMWGRFSYFPSLGKIAVLPDFGQQWYTYNYTAVAPTTSNTLTIRNEGVTTTNYPVQIGRAFAQGEIPLASLPQAWVGNTAVSTQVDVKTRWPDGSLKHAIISFLIPSFTGGATVTVTLAPGTTVGNTALTKAQMQAAGFNFDAVISLTKGGVTKTASAATMLNNGDYTVWASGPIATTILLGNHAQGTTCGGKAASAYDFGFDSFCAFRPLFEATFWAGTNQVYVRYIGELSNTEQLEDIAIDSMSLTAGSTSPASVYSRSTALTMYMGSRWTKTAWIGGTPPVAGYNHNLAYLISTKAVPNYDTSKVISGAVLSSAYTTWQSTAKDIYDAGEWQKAMGAPGGRPDIGPYPSWVVRWLYTGDYRAQQEAIGNADIATSWAMHFREGKSGKFLDRSGLVSGVGRVMSVSTRPSICIVCGYNYSYTNVPDRLVPVGTYTDGGWLPDAAHQPDPFSVPYLLTGDFFYLEQMQFWASFTTALANGAQTTGPNGRGPTGAEGGLAGFGALQTRGQAWGFRNRVQTAWLTPDAMPEKTYFDTLAQDAIAIWEGQRNVTGTSYQGGALWNWGVNPGRQMWGSLGIPSLHFWEPGDPVYVQYPIDGTVTSNGHSLWEINFVIYALGRAKELGYATQGLLNYVGPYLISQVTDPTYNPWLVGAYRIPTQKISTGAYFTSWADVKTGYLAAAQTGTSFAPMYSGGDCTSNASDCYAYFASAAMSMVADQSSGSTAWAWMLANVESLSATQSEPKWAILPRSTTPVPPPPTTGAGTSFRGGLRGVIR